MWRRHRFRGWFGVGVVGCQSGPHPTKGYGFVVEVRVLVLRDAALFRALRLQALRAEPTSFGASYEDHCDRTEADFRAWIENSAPGAVFGAFDVDALVGVAGLKQQEGRKNCHKGYLWGVYVAPPYRGRGVARALVGAVIALAREIVVVLQCSVQTGNSQAQRLYESLGFAGYGMERKAICVDGVYYDEAHLALDFSTP